MVFFAGIDGFDQLAVAIVTIDDMVAKEVLDSTGGVQAAAVLEVTEAELHHTVIENFDFNSTHFKSPQLLCLLPWV
jgi:hypothetical protein